MRYGAFSVAVTWMVFLGAQDDPSFHDTMNESRQKVHPREKKRERGKRRCTKCNRAGHMKKNCLVRNDGDDSGDKTSIDTQTSFGTEEVRASQGPYGFLRDISSAKYKSKCICTARIWASGCFVAVSAYEDRLALFSMSGIGNDIVDEEEAYLKTSFLRVPTMIMKAKLKQQCGGQFTSKMEGMIGHYLSASALIWASTQNDKLKDKMSAIVAGLSACQQKIGTGYLSAFLSEYWPAKATDQELNKEISERIDSNKAKDRKSVDRSSCGSNTTSSSELETDALEKDEQGKEVPEIADANNLAIESSNRRSRSVSNLTDSWKEVSEEGRLAFQALFAREVLPQSFSPLPDLLNKDQEMDSIRDNKQTIDIKDEGQESKKCSSIF
ncbi:Protein LHY [Arachis hypogaea]|uniref:Protein LHY n=1 Tax=Arachis hypogaea TaxID=3818 RepID=A0A6B9VB08_ARAHY|nr:Protein LHY [Arachis hypogaea]